MRYTKILVARHIKTVIGERTEIFTWVQNARFQCGITHNPLVINCYKDLSALHFTSQNLGRFMFVFKGSHIYFRLLKYCFRGEHFWRNMRHFIVVNLDEVSTSTFIRLKLLFSKTAMNTCLKIPFTRSAIEFWQVSYSPIVMHLTPAKASAFFINNQCFTPRPSGTTGRHWGTNGSL